ncbi:MAG: hypothetical protein WC197_05065 [Candidatus Gastranaerophilaceae bacterium]|jgi:hypothetical protein
MKKNQKINTKKTAFTFAEVLMMLIVTGFIAILSIPVFTEKNFDYRLYASVYNTFKKVNENFLTDHPSGLLDMENYCNYVTATVNYSKNDPLNCANSFQNDFTSVPDKPNFVFINGVRVYGLENAFYSGGGGSGSPLNFAYEGGPIIYQTPFDGSYYIQVYGASGASGGGGTGGYGGYTYGYITLPAGTQLTVIVGGSGTFNALYGGGGGGSSAVKNGSTGTYYIISGGGGGGGGNCGEDNGGHGAGGGGGGTGGDGGANGGNEDGVGGGGAAGAGAGAGISGYSGNGGWGYNGPINPGGYGTGYGGGAGGGGGGGGGYGGGGGGAAMCGGGGGGGSYIDSSVTGSGGSYGLSPGDGLVRITPPAAPAPAPPITVKINVRRGLYPKHHTDSATDSSVNNSDILGFYIYQDGTMAPRYQSEQAIIDKYSNSM